MIRRILSYIGVLAAFTVLSGLCAMAQQPPATDTAFPDLIVYNGKIVTMGDASLNNSPGKIVEAMAIRGDRIQELGSNNDVLRSAGPKTRKVDLKGRTVVPGWIDTHSHMHDHSVQLWSKTHEKEIESVAKRFSVSGKTFQDLTHGIQVVIKENMSHPTPGQWAWIDLPNGGESGTGIGVQYLLKDGMTRKQLDDLAPEMPVFVLSHPSFLLNTAARNAFLDLYEVPPTDQEEKVALTMDTTITRSLVVDQYFKDHLDELANVLEDGLKHEAAAGFTTFSSHIVGLRIQDAYMKLVRADRMPIRFGFAHRFCQQVEPDPAGCMARLGDTAGLGDKYFWNVGATLGGLDAGPPEICTTMEAPAQYKSQERCLLQPGNAYAKAIHAALKSHLRYVVNHDYGDKSIDYTMDIMDQVMREDPAAFTPDYMRSRRFSADHCGFYPRQDQLPRMKRLGMIISCDAMFLDRSAPWLKVYGMDKANRIAPIHSMIAAGIMPTAEAELWNIETGTSETYPSHLIHLITRKNSLGQVLAPDEAVDRVTAMKMATVWPSYYVLKEKEIGTLEPGKLADFLVLNKDYFTVPESEIGGVFPLMTVLGGKTIVLRKELADEIGQTAVGPQIQFLAQTKYEGTTDINAPKKGGGD
jgi:predicted amidohydrolase YtcJ